MATIKQKYEFLLSHLKLHDVDLWENDALLSMEKAIYLQFPSSTKVPWTLDEAVDAALQTALSAPTPQQPVQNIHAPGIILRRKKT